jgi:hypothetical protein
LRNSAIYIVMLSFTRNIGSLGKLGITMKVAGFLLLLAGWALVVTALAMLRSPAQRTAFVLAGFAVEILGAVLAARAHRVLAEESE